MTEIELTLPPREGALLREAYADAGAILEYGGGGSTVVAASASGRHVMCVESDPEWCDRLRAATQAMPSVPVLHHADIGPVGAWGRPVSRHHWPRFHRYATSVWDREDLVHPDVVLIDGLLRAACFATCAIRITRPVLVLFDDYQRTAYHVVERLLKPALVEGRLAVFELTPGLVGPSDLTLVQEMFGQMNYGAPHGQSAGAGI